MIGGAFCNDPVSRLRDGRTDRNANPVRASRNRVPLRVSSSDPAAKQLGTRSDTSTVSVCCVPLNISVRLPTTCTYYV